MNLSAVHRRQQVKAEDVHVLKGIDVGVDEAGNWGVPLRGNLYAHVGVDGHVDENEEEEEEDAEVATSGDHQRQRFSVKGGELSEAELS